MSLAKSRPRNAFLTLVAICVCTGIVAAQEKPDRPPWAQPSGGSPAKTADPAQAKPKAQNKSQDTASERGKIRVHVNLVNVLASVLDEHNRPAPYLPIEAFQLYEEGVPQKIEFFESETQQPLDLALMIDASLSAHQEITFERAAAAHFIAQVIRPGDRLSVYAFDESVTQIAGFSDNVASLQAAIHKIQDGAGTSIYDAVLLGSRALEKRPDDHRRVIIMVTDAGETTSRADFDTARKAAVKADVLLYTIVIRPVKNEGGRNTAGEHALETITDSTGGAMFFPDTSQELDIIFDRIDRELRTQYRLAYYPRPHGPADTYRTIEVRVLHGDYHVRHRTIYLAGPQ